MKNLLKNMMVAFLCVMASFGLGLKLNDIRFYIVVVVLLFSYYMLSNNDSTRSFKGNN